MGMAKGYTLLLVTDKDLLVTQKRMRYCSVLESILLTHGILKDDLWINGVFKISQKRTSIIL